MDGKPNPPVRGDFHGYLGRIIPSERDLLETAIFPPHDATVGEARVIEWQTDPSLDGLRERIVKHRQAALRQVRIDVQPTVPIPRVRPPQVNDVTVENGAVPFV